MLLLDTDKAIRTIMLRRHSDGTSSQTPTAPSVTKEPDGTPDPRHAAAEDMMQAMHDGHAGRMVEAMGKFHDAHAAHNEKQSAEAPTPKESEEES